MKKADKEEYDELIEEYLAVYDNNKDVVLHEIKHMGYIELYDYARKVLRRK